MTLSLHVLEDDTRTSDFLTSAEGNYFYNVLLSLSCIYVQLIASSYSHLICSSLHHRKLFVGDLYFSRSATRKHAICELQNVKAFARGSDKPPRSGLHGRCSSAPLKETGKLMYTVIVYLC